MTSIIADPQSVLPNYACKFGLFLFGTSPWQEEETNRTVLIGLTSWIVSAETGVLHPNSQEVTVQWPIEPFDNYLKLSRGANRTGKKFAMHKATLLYISNSAYSINFCSKLFDLFLVFCSEVL